MSQAEVFRNSYWLSILLVSLWSGAVSSQMPTSEKSDSVTIDQIVSVGVEKLLEIQNDDGAWPYEGVYRVKREIPVGYRIGGTAICCEALLYATPANHEAANLAINRGVAMILKELEHPLMKPSQENRYDVRVWGHIYALDLFCRMKFAKRFPDLDRQIEPWIKTLTETLVHEELEKGGWNYANRRAHAAFVSAPAIQALLLARKSGQAVPAGVFERASEAFVRSNNSSGAYAYSGDDSSNRPAKLPGSIARSAASEFTLTLLGVDRGDNIKKSLDAFHEHWDELEKRRKKTGTHKPPYGVAPYYFYYGHRYAAQAIQGLQERERARQYEKFNKVLMKTRDEDGTWNDRVFARSRAYGTAMSLLALVESKTPFPTQQ